MSDDALRALAADSANALNIGKAAEHLVCADLLLSGYQAYLSDQGLSYDVVVDLGAALIRIQVKASCFARNMNSQGRTPRVGYTFFSRRRGKKGHLRLENSHCDIVAFAALDIRKIAYFPVVEVATTTQLHPPGYVFRGKYKRSKIFDISKYPFEDALGRILKCP